MKKIILFIALLSISVSHSVSAEVYLNSSRAEITTPSAEKVSNEEYYAVPPGKSITINYTTMRCDVIGGSPIATIKNRDSISSPKEGYLFVRAELTVHSKGDGLYKHSETEYLLVDVVNGGAYEFDKNFTEMAMRNSGINGDFFLNKGRTVVIPLIFQIPKTVDFTKLSLLTHFTERKTEYALTFEPATYTAWWD